MNTNLDLLVIVLGVCLGVLLVGTMIAKFFMNVYMPFADDRDFIRMEIVRSHGNEKVHWQHELRRLYIGMIPFVGEFLVNRSRAKGKKQREKM